MQEIYCTTKKRHRDEAMLLGLPLGRKIIASFVELLHKGRVTPELDSEAGGMTFLQNMVLTYQTTWCHIRKTTT
jgi:hypothetical protein